MTQICKVREEATPVRRMLYPRSSPAGQGIRWDWLGDRFSEWIEYSMNAQNAIESAWSLVKNFFYTLYIERYIIIRVFNNLGTSNSRFVKDMLKYAIHNQFLQPNTSKKRHRICEKC